MVSADAKGVVPCGIIPTRAHTPPARALMKKKAASLELPI